MKLNKPPVTEEQSILEEYVGFLLTDLSNVHPIKQESNKDTNQDSHSPSHKQISDLVEKQSPSSNEPKLSVAPLNKSSDIEKAAEIEEKPKWSTIEKASIKRKSKQQQIENQSTEQAPLEVEDKEINKEQVQIKPPEPLVQEEQKQSSINSHDFVEEEPEEEQLKK